MAVDSTHPKRAPLWISGFIQGFATGLLCLGLARFLVAGFEVWREWPFLAMMAFLAGVVVGLGTAIAGNSDGALIGAIVGVVLGGWLSSFLPPWNFAYTVMEDSSGRIGQLMQVSGPGLDGKPLSSEDYRGKYLLIDFWATWCGPCVQELPHVRQTYKDFADRGFDVLAVNLDEDREQVTAFLKENDIPWKQIFFEDPNRRGWMNPLVAQFGIEGIPATFLLDPAGKLVAENLRGNGLKEAVRGFIEKGSQLSEAPPGKTYRIVFVPLHYYLTMAGSALILAVIGSLLQRSRA
ncbi:MAG: redoxin domain-containing protein [Gemmataceae bacterium]